MEENANPRVILTTSMGEITLELFAAEAPVTTKNFLDYVGSGHYEDLTFHRVIPGFMIQGGGFNKKMKEKRTKDPIQNEAANGVKNERGTVAMARTPDPHSATSQFFINLKDNGFLNHTAQTPQGWGYAVFGKVVAGMDVVDAIAAVETCTYGSYENVPDEPVIITRAVIAA